MNSSAVIKDVSEGGSKIVIALTIVGHKNMNGRTVTLKKIKDGEVVIYSRHFKSYRKEIYEALRGQPAFKPFRIIGLQSLFE